VQTETRAYDALNRLSTDTFAGPTTPSQTITLSYDLHGNLASMASLTGSHGPSVAATQAACPSCHCEFIGGHGTVTSEPARQRTTLRGTPQATAASHGTSP
jgi:YD repeat-containing protein